MFDVLRSVFVAIFISVAGVCLGAAQNRKSVTGFVFGENRMPLSRVYVELQTDMYPTYARTQTNRAGMYSFQGIPDGRYYVKVLPHGTNYQEQGQVVSLLPLPPVGRSAISEQLDFYLQSRTAATPAGASAHASDGAVVFDEQFDICVADGNPLQPENESINCVPELRAFSWPALMLQIPLPGFLRPEGGSFAFLNEATNRKKFKNLDRNYKTSVCSARNSAKGKIRVHKFR